MSVWSVTTVPAAKPLVLADVKNYLKVPTTVTTDDDFITALIAEAVDYVERMTSRALITQTITEYWDSFPASTDKYPRVLFPSVAPVQSIAEATGLSYVADDASSLTYTAWDNTSNAFYYVDNVSGSKMFGPARIFLKAGVSWPTVAADYLNTVKVVYVAGYGASGSSVPGPLLTAMRRLIGIWYYGRDNRNLNDYDVVAALLNPYKVNK